MSTEMSDEELLNIARQRVKKKKDFYQHLGIYILVNTLLIIIWATTDGSANPVPWFVYPLGGWGIGIFFHFLDAFVFSRETGWEKREVEKEMDKLRRGGS